MRRLLLLLCLLFLALSANAQKRDSLLVVNARWTIDSLDGMVLKRMHFTHKECIGSNQFIAILEIPSESPRRLAFSSSRYLSCVRPIAAMIALPLYL